MATYAFRIVRPRETCQNEQIKNGISQSPFLMNVYGVEHCLYILFMNLGFIFAVQKERKKKP